MDTIISISQMSNLPRSHGWQYVVSGQESTAALDKDGDTAAHGHMFFF